jgi:hypothetical protein
MLHKGVSVISAALVNDRLLSVSRAERTTDSEMQKFPGSTHELLSGFARLIDIDMCVIKINWMWSLRKVKLVHYVKTHLDVVSMLSFIPPLRAMCCL